MKKITVIILLLLTISCADQPKTGDELAVQQCFNLYKSAILKQNGAEAIAQLDSGTIKLYQEYLDWALYADEERLNELSLINRMQAILIRHRIPLEKLNKMNGAKLLVYAIDNDWIGKNGVIRTEIGKIYISNERASADVLNEGKKVLIRFQFNKEEGLWKMDLSHILESTNILMLEAVKDSGKPENEFIFLMSESVSGQKISETIWDPLIKE